MKEPGESVNRYVLGRKGQWPKFHEKKNRQEPNPDKKCGSPFQERGQAQTRQGSQEEIAILAELKSGMAVDSLSTDQAWVEEQSVPEFSWPRCAHVGLIEVKLHSNMRPRVLSGPKEEQRNEDLSDDPADYRQDGSAIRVFSWRLPRSQW